MAEIEIRVDLYNLKEITVINQVIENEDLKVFLCSFLRQENDYDELVRRKEELGITPEEILTTMKEFVVHGCTVCTEFFLLQFKTLFEAETLTALAELAIKNRQLEILKVLHNHGAVLLEDFLTNAIVNLDAPIVKYLVFLDVGLDDNDAERLVDFLATRVEGYDIYLILEELMRSQGKIEILKDVLRLANEADNELLISYLMRKNLVPIKERVMNGLLPIDGVSAIDNNVEARWAEKNWRRWTKLNTRILKSLTGYNIITLDLSNNKLANLIPAFFDGTLPFLSILALNDNNIETLPDLPYPCNNQLVKLDLKRNKLKELPFIYLCMARIEQLLLLKNEIIRFTFWDEEDPSKYLTAATESNLKILILSENLLETIPEELGQFRRMTELKCKRNRIESFPANWHLSSRLEEIDLSSNMLGFIAFQHPPGLWKMTLHTLLLASNKFTWIPQFVPKLRMLLNLDLNNNDLHNFPADPLWECQLSELKIANNHRLFPHEQYGISNNLHVEIMRPNLACFEKTLFSLDISNNDLFEVPAFVHSLKNLRFLYLNHNPNLNDLPPELSLLQKLKAISVEETPLANLPKEHQPTQGQIYLKVSKIIKYLEEIRLNSENMYAIQLVLLGSPSVVLQRLELDIMGVSRKKLVLDSPRMENIKMYDTQMYSSGRRTESIFSMTVQRPPLKIRMWLIDNIDGFNSIKYMIESERTLYILATDIAKRYVGCIEAKEWLQAIFDTNLRIPSGRVATLLDLSQQIEKDVQREIIANFRHWEPIHKFHATFLFKDTETIRKEVYNWANTICSKLSKVPEYMLKVFGYFEGKEKNGDIKLKEFVFQKNEFFGICERNSRGHCWSDKDKTEFSDLLQSCGYLFHCKDTWSGLDNFYFTKPNVFFDFILRFVKTSHITIQSECGKARLSELEEIIQCYSPNERVTTAIIAILEQYELAFKITDKIILAVQFLHGDRPAIIAKSELMEFENSFYMQAKGTDRIIVETPQYNRLYCFEQTPRHFFSLLIVYLTSHSKQASDYQFKPSEWNLVLWENGIEAFIGDQHILITQANIDQLSNNILSNHIVRGRKIVDEQTIELRRAGFIFFISVAIYSKSAHESLKKLGNICDAIENLARQEQFLTISDGCCRMIPCSGCIENAYLHLLSIEDLLASGKESYYCDTSKQRYIIEELLPEYFLKDQPNHILITNKELNFNKNTSKRIGEGTEGTVYKHMYKGREVAVKVRTKSHFPDVKRSKEYLDMRKEAVFLQKLQHSYLMGIIAVTTSPLCLVLEYATYSSLNKVLDYHLQEYGLGAMKNGVLGTILTHQIAIEIASALEYLHRNNIIYFDLKSANVLVLSLDMHSQVHVKLTDYGISEMIVPKGFKGYRGTYGFMAPELYPEEGIYLAVDEKVDVYSYAIFLCELLFGRNPASGDRNLFEKVRNGVRPMCSSKEIPFHLFSLIQRCWEQLPQMRPSASEILQELADVKFVMKNKAANINTRGIITGAYQMVGATLPTEKGIDLTKSMMETLFPPSRPNISLSNSSSAAAKDLSGSYNSDNRSFTPNLQSKLPSINQTVRYDMSCDASPNRTEQIDFNSYSTPASADADDSAVIISSSTELETDIIMMKTTTGEYYNDLRIEYPHVTSIVTYNSFMWLAATKQKGEPGVLMMYSLPQMTLMFQENEDTVRKLIAFPLEETETSMDVNIILILPREIVVYQFQLRGDFLQPKDFKYDIVNFSKSRVYATDSKICGGCVVNKNELWFSFGKNNQAQLVVLDISFRIPKIIDELPPINNVIEIGEMIYAGKCIWLNDKGELNLWKIDHHTKRVHEFAQLVYNKENKTINRNGSIIQRESKPQVSPTHKLKKQAANPCNLNFQIKSFSAVEECRASREISHLENVNVKLQQRIDYLSQSAISLRPGLEHIDMVTMHSQAGTVDEFVAPIASLHAGNQTVWAFLGDGKICVFDSNTSYDQLSILCIIKTQAEFFSAKHLKIPAAITMTDSHVITIRKASNKEVIDMDGFDYYVEVWHNLTADDIRCYNRVVLAAHRAV